ncbi:hypothetical protein [Serratia marcescens]|uniref:DUF732 domain-containing protein n=1 Tax=Serratia marcescens TaxID=615 RepID=A0AAP8PG81_SERMA|nr:hypothetical protein [Serratia marcescens]PNO65039.1 hypothetical protein MC70_017700 [Serratia marcescens]
MKNYHIVGAVLLAGFILGLSVPAHAENVGVDLISDAQNYGLIMARKTGSECEVSREPAEALILSHIVKQANRYKVSSDYTAAAIQAAIMQYDLTCKLNLSQAKQASNN